MPEQDAPCDSSSHDPLTRVQDELENTSNHLEKTLYTLRGRGEKLETLQDKTDNLAFSAQGFRRGANCVRKEIWWKEVKMYMWIAIGVIILLSIIIVPAVVISQK